MDKHGITVEYTPETEDHCASWTLKVADKTIGWLFPCEHKDQAGRWRFSAPSDPEGDPLCRALSLGGRLEGTCMTTYGGVHHLLRRAQSILERTVTL